MVKINAEMRISDQATPNGALTIITTGEVKGIMLNIFASDPLGF